MLADYHIHTPYCGHAKGSVVDYIHAAIDRGVQEIGFADHLGRYYLTDSQRRRYWDWGMKARDLSPYVADVLECKELFAGQVAIRVGLEVDYIEGAEDLLEPFILRYPFDYLLCSIHCIPQLGWRHLANYSSTADSSDIYKEYFRLARAALTCRLFNVLAHPDFIWRYIAWPRRDASMPFQEIAELVTTAARTGGTIEINANGYLWSQTHTESGRDPFETMVDLLAGHRVPISIGSDAHEPGSVGKSLAEIMGFLLRKGITTVTCFSEGKPRQEVLG